MSIKIFSGVGSSALPARKSAHTSSKTVTPKLLRPRHPRLYVKVSFHRRQLARVELEVRLLARLLLFPSEMFENLFLPLMLGLFLCPVQPGCTITCPPRTPRYLRKVQRLRPPQLLRFRRRHLHQLILNQHLGNRRSSGSPQNPPHRVHQGSGFPASCAVPHSCPVSATYIADLSLLAILGSGQAATYKPISGKHRNRSSLSSRLRLAANPRRWHAVEELTVLGHVAESAMRHQVRERTQPNCGSSTAGRAGIKLDRMFR